MQLHEERTIVEVCRITSAARSSVGRWIDWFTQGGMDVLWSLPVGSPTTLPVREMCVMLTVLVQFSTQDFGYQQSRWSTELLAMQLNDLFQGTVAASTVRRWLPKVGIVWRKATPTLNIRDPGKEEKLAQISDALDKCSVDHPVFYEDEVNIDLNPKIGTDWSVKGQQRKIVTPGQNCKHYLAEALHAASGKVLYVSATKKDSDLFIAMLEKLKRHCRWAKSITLILDNYIIHKSKKTKAWIKKNQKFRLLFQSVYCP